MPGKNSAARPKKNQQHEKTYFPMRSRAPGRVSKAVKNSRLLTVRVPSRNVVLLNPTRDRVGTVNLFNVVSQVVLGPQLDKSLTRSYAEVYHLHAMMVHPKSTEVRIIPTVNYQPGIAGSAVG
jgi:hypothetical protein